MLTNIEIASAEGSRPPSSLRRIRPLSYRCCLCKFSGPGKLLLMAHVRSMKHLQMEQVSKDSMILISKLFYLVTFLINFDSFNKLSPHYSFYRFINYRKDRRGTTITQKLVTFFRLLKTKTRIRMTVSKVAAIS